MAAASLVVALLGFGGCAQSPQQLAETHHSKEYFPASVYGRASRRVIADGQPVPHGGGQYLVGKPYTIAGQTYYPSERKVTQVGLASWYGDAFHGRLTANGEVYDRDGFTAAHPTMPLPSYARVTNLRNNYSMIVRVNDRGPYHSNRVMDVSRRVAEALDFQRGGTAKVKVEYVGHASLAGSDNSKLYATMRTNGPARLQGVEDPTMVAETPPQPASARVASLEPYAAAPVPPDRNAVEEVEPAPRAVHRDHHATAIPSDRQEEEPVHAHRRTEEAEHPVLGHHTKDAVRHEEARAREKRDEKPIAGHREEHGVRVASHGAGVASAHWVKTEPRMPAPRPGGAGVERRNTAHNVSAHAASPAPRIAVMPPARPTKVAVTTSPGVIRHNVAGLRLTRSKDD